MGKLMITMNFISIAFLFAILSRVRIPSTGITGFTTAVSNASFEFQPFIIPAFLFILAVSILNIYFFIKRMYYY